MEETAAMAINHRHSNLDSHRVRRWRAVGIVEKKMVMLLREEGDEDDQEGQWKRWESAGDDDFWAQLETELGNNKGYNWNINGNRNRIGEKRWRMARSRRTRDAQVDCLRSRERDDRGDDDDGQAKKGEKWGAQLIVEMMTAKGRRGSLAKGKENRARREGWASGKEEENGPKTLKLLFLYPKFINQ